MLINAYLAQELARQRMKDSMRQAEQERLIRQAARGSRTLRGWRLLVTLIFRSLTTLLSGARS